MGMFGSTRCDHDANRLDDLHAQLPVAAVRGSLRSRRRLNRTFGTYPFLQMRAYCAMKAAGRGRQRSLAGDTSGHTIAVFAYRPRVVRTSMIAQVTGSHDVPKEVRDRIRAPMIQRDA